MLGKLTSKFIVDIIKSISFSINILSFIVNAETVSTISILGKSIKSFADNSLDVPIPLPHATIILGFARLFFILSIAAAICIAI
ncbi:hypothetical protein D3C76_1053080 [compost metagenome]